jgi:gluconate 2-dehydrogenase gamma chain
MKPVGISPWRRAFLRGVAAAAPAATVAGVIGTSAASALTAPQPYRPRYFNDIEWTTLNALVDRLIPADEHGPGAIEAGVSEFIDRQMNTPYGYGALWYMNGPFLESASPEFGYQLPHSPRSLYRNALTGLDLAVQKQTGKRFGDLTASEKDGVLHQLETGKLNIGEIPTADFFAQLLQNTREGYFCDPKHGGNRDMAAWKMINFPGARADFMDWVEQYGERYPLPPSSSV